MKLNLKNPIVFFDLETTGTNIITDRIVEICYLKVYPNGNEESKTLRINPGMHIPEAASAVHGIYDADVADCPTFKEVAKSIANQVKTYSMFKTIDCVIISWVIWNKDTNDILKNALSDFEIYNICLECPEDTLLKRVKTDIENKKRHSDNLQKINRQIFSDGFIKISSNQDLQTVINEILRLINN